MSERDPIADTIIQRGTPNKPGEVILARNGRDAYVVVGKDGKGVRKLPPDIAARHHARAQELIAAAREQHHRREVAEEHERDRVAALPWHRAARWIAATWAALALGARARIIRTPLWPTLPEPLVDVPPSPIPARTQRQRARRKARANAR